MEFELEIPPEIVKAWEERGGPIVKYPDPVLFEVAKPVERPVAATRSLVERMKEAMTRDHGVGLAAPQLGVLERVIVYRLPEESAPFRVVVNPKIISRKGEQIGQEGCLSIPFLQGDVKRAGEVIVKGIDLLGRPFKRRAADFEARIIQHEVDHLDGILFVEKADPDTIHWAYGEAETDEDAETREE